VARALCETFGGALVSTSANRSGRPPAISATQIRLAFRRSVDAIVPGPLGGRSAPTTIRDVISGMILRR
jgi:L-threonylcarbamoyladenylate synthase